MKSSTLNFGLVMCILFYPQTDSGGVKKCFSCRVTCEDPPAIEYCPGSNYSCVIVTAVFSEPRPWFQRYNSSDKLSLETMTNNLFEFSGCRGDTTEEKKSCLEIDYDDGASCFLCDTDLCNWDIVNGNRKHSYSISILFFSSLSLILIIF